MLVLDYKTIVEINKNAQQEVDKVFNVDSNIKQNSQNKEEYTSKYDSVYTMEDSSALVLYIIVMIVGTIFVDRWLIYITATIIYWKFRTRHKKK